MYFHMQAEEMIKTEMLQMLRNDIVHHPSEAPHGNKAKSYITSLKAELDKQPLEKFTQEELQEVICIYMYSIF